MSKNYQVFVSHSWEHADVLMRLRTLLQECPNFYAEFTEAPPHDPIEAPSH